MKKLALILCLAMVLSSFSGCAGEEAYVPTGDALEDATVPTEETQATAPGMLETEPQVFTMAYYAADGFNPYLCSGYTNRLFFSLLYQGLFSVGRDNHVEPVLCKRYSVSSDMRSFTFYLEQATFSDGSYVTAQDVVASLQAAQDSDVYGGRFTHISSFEAVEGNAVSITTTTAYENLPLLLDIPVLKSTQVGESMPAGTGPYVLVQNSSGLALQRRSDWWCEAQLPITAQSVALWQAADAVQIRDRFEFSDLGVAYADPGAGSYADYRCDYEVWDCETGIFLYLGYSSNSDVFSNEEVRAALTYAIDRQKLLEECYNGFGQEATLAASPGSPYYDKGLAGQVDYNPDHFRNVLAQNGLQGSSIVLLVNKSDSVRLQTAQLIAQMLTDCGLVVELVDHSTSYYLQRVYAGNYDLYLGQTRLSANMDLSEFFRPYGNMSFGGMSDPTIYAMCQEALENSGNYYNLHQLVLEDGRLTPVLFRTYAVYMKRGLMDGLSPARDNVFWYSIGKSMEDALITE